MDASAHFHQPLLIVTLHLDQFLFCLELVVFGNLALFGELPHCLLGLLEQLLVLVGQFFLLRLLLAYYGEVLILLELQFHTFLFQLPSNEDVLLPQLLVLLLKCNHLLCELPIVCLLKFGLGLYSFDLLQT